MKVLVLYAHPVETSFAAAIHKEVLSALKENGHQVDDCDLYAEGFDACLSRQERLDYHNPDRNRENVEAYVSRLLAAEALVLVTPVWNFGYPAILKGFLDRVFLPGVSFTLEGGKVVPSLKNIRRLGVCTTYGASRFRAMLAGDPPRLLAKRVLRALIRRNAKVDYLALYNMNTARIDRRRNFLHTVRCKFSTWEP